MSQILVRKLDPDVKEKLQERARRHGRSTEAEAREILRTAVLSQPDAPLGLGSRIASHFAGKGLDFEVEELRGQPAKPARFRR